MFSLLLGVLYILTPTVWGDISQRATLANNLASNGTGTPYSMNVTDCPGGTAIHILWSCY
jgi:alpha-glucosidase